MSTYEVIVRTTDGGVGSIEVEASGPREAKKKAIEIRPYMGYALCQRHQIVGVRKIGDAQKELTK